MNEQMETETYTHTEIVYRSHNQSN